MKIRYNSEETALPAPVSTVDQFLSHLELNRKMVLVKINGRVIKHSEYRETVISDGDDVTILPLIAGA